VAEVPEGGKETKSSLVLHRRKKTHVDKLGSFAEPGGGGFPEGMGGGGGQRAGPEKGQPEQEV